MRAKTTGLGPNEGPAAANEGPQNGAKQERSLRRGEKSAHSREEASQRSKRPRQRAAYSGGRMIHLTCLLRHTMIRFALPLCSDPVFQGAPNGAYNQPTTRPPLEEANDNKLSLSLSAGATNDRRQLIKWCLLSSSCCSSSCGIGASPSRDRAPNSSISPSALGSVWGPKCWRRNWRSFLRAKMWRQS